MNINDACWIILSYIFSPDASISYQKRISKSLPQRYKICRQVAQAAKNANFDPIIAISVAYHETRFTHKESDKGAQGPLGVLRKYHCPKQGKCDLIKAGIRALIKFHKLNPDNQCNALAQYNGGLDMTCEEPSRSSFYAQRVLDTYYEVKHFNQRDQFDTPIH